MRVTGFWQSWLLPLILVLTLVGVSRGLRAETTASESAVGSTAGAPALPPPGEPPAAGHATFTLHAFRIVGANIQGGRRPA